METYTIFDILNRGYNLEPLTCIHCGHVGETTFHSGVGDANCEMCGMWQLDPCDGCEDEFYCTCDIDRNECEAYKRAHDFAAHGLVEIE